ncbi:MAG TPA: hypothetical protein VGI39_26865 [Polyangiaceae bacterium]|jgi:hypothetical protein
MRVAIAWEDEYFRPLERIVLARRGALRPPDARGYLELIQYTLRGNGRFAAHVESSWPRVRAQGVPASSGKIEHLICVVDADKLRQLLPATIEPPPHSPEAVAEWHIAAEAAFVEHLRGRAAGGEPSTVHGLVLRWAKESLSLAAFDRIAAGEKLGVDTAHPRVVTLFERCNPDPRAVSDALFTDAYRRPIACMDDLRRASGLPAVGKGSELDDVINALAGEDVEAVCRRVPDIDRLLKLAWQLAAGRRGPSSKPSIQAAASARKKKSK